MMSGFTVTTDPICYVNGKRYDLPLRRGEVTLLQFLRGIGNVRDGLHPVQERLAKSHGSQCGFCTPGFVMSMYALLRSSHKHPVEEDIEECIAGNLCRCTGYRPILDAFKTFAKVDPKAYTEEAIAAAKGLSTLDVATANSAATGGAICPSSGLPCDCSPGACASAPVAVPAAEAVGCGAGADCCMVNGDAVNPDCHKPPPAAAAPAKPTAEPIFPPELKKKPAGTIYLPGPLVDWYRPTSLTELLDLKAQFPAARLVVGNTEVGIEMKFKDAGYKHIVAVTHIPELNEMSVVDGGVMVGGSVTLTRMREYFEKLMGSRPAHEVRGLRAVVQQLRWFAGKQIQNVASLAGNICTASPISDLNPLWMAMGATFTLVCKDGGERTVAADKFFISYRKVDMQPQELLKCVFVPFTRQHEFVREYKQSPRREDDIAIVNAGVRVRLEPSAAAGGGDGGWVVAEAAVSFGGVAAKTIMAPEVAKAMVGRPWDRDVLKAALDAVQHDVVMADNAPGGKVAYRRALTASFLFKFFAQVSVDLEEATPGYHSGLSEEERSAAVVFQRPPAHGVQFFAEVPPEMAVGQPVPHLAAQMQTSGEAMYTDDLKHSQDLLHAALVLSTKPHAKLLGVDPAPALALPGVVGYYSASDVPGENHIGAVIHDEEVFATSEVKCVGQVIGVVVAESEAVARRAAKLVAVRYEDLPALMSAAEAAVAQAFYPFPFNQPDVIASGDVDGILASCQHVIEGDFKAGGQEHFYLEPQNCSVVPGEDNEFTCWASSQGLYHHQESLSHVLGVPNHKIVCKTKRVGGGFGGKETRGIFIHCAIAVPAYHLKRPVRLCLDRDEDMQITGERHAIMGRYKVGFTPEGRVLAADLHLYINAGCSLDLSAAIVQRAMLHSDCGYGVPAMRVKGYMCATNQASNTAFRGFGGPQGMIVCEAWMERIARTLGRPVHEVRDLNLCEEGYVTHYGQTLEHCRMRACWDQVMANSGFSARFEAAKDFNAKSRYRKRGLAITPTKFGISFTAKHLNQAGALVHIYGGDGSVLVTHGGVEMGQGLHTKMAQVAAMALGSPLSNIHISETSTDKVPNASPSAASASADMYGQAVLDACTQLAQRLEPFRQKMPGASFKELAHAAYMERVDLSAHGFYRTPDVTGYGGTRPFNYFCYGAAASEVEMDTLTGDWHLLRTDIVMDVGNPLNPAIDIGQVEGGFVQGMGWLCLEELLWGDAEHAWVRPGMLFTRGPGTYKIPSANDIPIDFRVTLLQHAPNVRAIHSSKAVGEPPFELGASVFFALKEACYAAREAAGHGSAWFNMDAPATPERLRMACADDITAAYAPADMRAKISC